MLADVATGLRFFASLPPYLRQPIRLETARAQLRTRLGEREASFLRLVRRTIFDNPSSPNRQLLRLVGCEPGDLERLVRDDGLAGALQGLARQGVYLSADELKGRPVVRGSFRTTFAPSQFRNPLSAAHLLTHTGGSRGERTPVAIDLGSVRVQAANWALVLAARGGLDWLHAHWNAPGSAVVGRLLQFGVIETRQARWFSQVDPGAAGLHPRYRWTARALWWGSRLAGRPLPGPEYVPVDRPLPIARWLAEVLRQGRIPHIWTFTSSAVRVCQAALEAGLAIEGAHFTVSGEPVTAARLDTIRRAGGRPLPFCGASEAGMLGLGCLAPRVPDDLHAVTDQHVFIRAEASVSPTVLPSDALLLTSLQSTARLILLNASLGDRAELGASDCGCPLAELGWTTRLYQVRSFEKLNVGGIALADSSVIQVLEEILPQRFGGGPTDYQLVEGESDQGGSDLRLRVDPRLGPLDERALAETFLKAVGEGSGVEHLVELQWRQAGLPRIERRSPSGTSVGKIHHLHQERPTVNRQ